MKFEFSAGGIVYRRTKIEGRRTVEILVAQHSGHHGWVFPKGLIGDHPSTDSASPSTMSSGPSGSLQAGSGQAKETKEEAAIREVREETGINGRIIKALQPVTYWYNFEGVKIKKTVYYFLMECQSGDTKNHDWEMQNVEWIPEEKVLDKLTYRSDKQVWQEAKQLIADSK